MNGWLRWTSIVIVIVAWASTPASAEEVMECGDPFHNAYGPYDYTNPTDVREKLPIVEDYHLTDQIYRDALSGKVVDMLAGHLDYTLRAFPNHHKALYAMGMYQAALAQTDKSQLRSVTQRFHSAECYFQRALQFRPIDSGVHGTYGLYLNKIGKVKEALESMQRALQIDPESVEYNYDIGLIYLKLNNLEQASVHASKAYRGGYPLPYLRDELRRRGRALEP